MKKYFLIILFLFLQTFAQKLNFVIVDKLDATEENGKNDLVKLVNTINQFTGIDLVIFNGFSASLDSPDPLVIRTIKKMEHPLYMLLSTSDFWHDRSAREKFMNNYGDLNFRKTIDSTMFIGLNSTVAWSELPYFERETLNFIKREKLDSLSSSILILNSDPQEIKNFDRLAKYFNSSKIKFIAAPLSGNKEFIKDNISILNTSLSSRRNEAFQIVEVMNDTIKVTTSTIEGKLDKENIYTFNADKFAASKLEQPSGKKIKWEYDLGYSIASDVIYYNNKLYAADVSGQVVCLDTLGKKKWDYFSFGYIYSKPTARDDYLAIATVQGDLETINIATGKPIQSLGFNSPITSDLLSFDFPGNYNNLMIPKQSRSKAAVVAGTQNGFLYCYDLETLQELWRFEKPANAIIKKPVYVKGQLIFYSLDGNIYCVNAQTGRLSWSSKLTTRNESIIYSSNLVNNDEDVFISLSNGKLFSFDILLGKMNWEYDKYKLSTSLNISNDGRYLYAKSTNDRMHILSAKLGTWVREVTTKVGSDNSETEIVELGNNIYFGNDDGYLIKIDENYKVDKLSRTDNTPLFSITPIGKRNLVLTYHNGTISLIRIK